MSHTYALALMQETIAYGRWVDRMMTRNARHHGRDPGLIPGMPWARCVGTLRHTSGQRCGNLEDHGGNYVRAYGVRS